VLGLANAVMAASNHTFFLKRSDSISSIVSVGLGGDRKVQSSPYMVLHLHLCTCGRAPAPSMCMRCYTCPIPPLVASGRSSTRTSYQCAVSHRTYLLLCRTHLSVRPLLNPRSCYGGLGTCIAPCVASPLSVNCTRPSRVSKTNSHTLILFLQASSRPTTGALKLDLSYEEPGPRKPVVRCGLLLAWNRIISQPTLYLLLDNLPFTTNVALAVSQPARSPPTCHPSLHDLNIVIILSPK